jgi:L-lactate utilization protein LutC
VLAETGVYQVRVNASNLAATGAYNVGLECLRPPSSVDTHLSSGGLYSGNINAAAVVDLITFDGNVGDVVRVTLGMTAGFSAPFGITAQAAVLTPTGITLVTFNANAPRQITLTESGRHVILVYASNYVSGGTYNVGIEFIAPIGPTQAHLASGGLYSGDINAAAVVDVITFDGAVGENVTLTLAMTGGFNPPFGISAQATVLTPSGATMVTFNANGQRSVTLTESGRHIVIVRASNFVSAGTYNISRN